MRKFVLIHCLIVLTMLFFSRCNSTDDFDAGDNDPPNKCLNQNAARWTVLIHFALDNNLSDVSIDGKTYLERTYLQTLESIKAKDIDNKIEILVMMDGKKNKPYKDGYYRLTGGDFKNDLIVPIDEINSGGVEDSERFIDWVTTNYPGNRYFYSIHNHGKGISDLNTEGTGIYQYTPITNNGLLKSIAGDETQDDTLSNYELGQITKFFTNKIGKKIDLFYPFACLMGGVELVYQMRNDVKYMVLSEDIIKATDYSYDALDMLIKNPDATPRDLGNRLCENMYNYYQQKDTFLTISLVAPARINSLIADINHYSTHVTGKLRSNPEKAKLFFSVAASTYFMKDSKNFFMIDLGDYLKRVSISNDMDVLTRVYALKALYSMNKCIITHKQNSQPDSTGLTICHNIWYAKSQYSLDLYQSIHEFGKETSWIQYLRAMDELSDERSDVYEPDDDITSAKILPIDGSIHNRVMSPAKDIDYYKLDLSTINPETPIRIQKYADPVTSLWISMTLYNDKMEIMGETNISKDFYRENMIFINKVPGIYYLKMTAGDNCGRYSMSAHIETSVPTGDSYEPDDSFTTANNVNLGSGDVVEQSRSFNYNGDEDYVKINLTGSSNKGTLCIGLLESSYTTSSGKPASCTPDFYLYDESGTLLVYKSSFNKNTVLNIAYPFSDNRVFYLRIKENRNAIGQYKIQLGQLPSDIYESDDTPESASKIIINDTPQLHFRYTDMDVDRIYFEGKANQVVKLFFSVDQTKSNVYDEQIMCLIYHESDLTEPIDFAMTDTSLNFQCPQDGKYYLEVRRGEVFSSTKTDFMKYYIGITQ